MYLLYSALGSCFSIVCHVYSVAGTVVSTVSMSVVTICYHVEKFLELTLCWLCVRQDSMAVRIK